MSRFRSTARFLVHHWFLVVAVAVNMAIAAPAGAVRWDNDVCETEDGEGVESCCTTCWFFCACTYDGYDDGDGDDGGDDGDGGDGGDDGGGAN